MKRFKKLLCMSSAVFTIVCPMNSFNANAEEVVQNQSEENILKLPEGYNDLKELVKFMIGFKCEKDPSRDKCEKDEYKRITHVQGDILIGEDSGDSEIKKAKLNDTITFTGTLDVSVIKEAMGFANMGWPYGRIVNPSSTFVLKFTLDDKMYFDKKPTMDNIKLIGAKNKAGEDIFKITKVESTDKELTVTMDFVDPVMLKAKKENKVYIVKELDYALNSMDKILKIDIPNVKFDTKNQDESKRAKKGDKLTVRGKVYGNYAMDRITAAHYDPRLTGMEYDYMAHPEKIEKFQKILPKEYEEYIKNRDAHIKTVNELKELAKEVKEYRDKLVKWSQGKEEFQKKVSRYDNFTPYTIDQSNEEDFVFPENHFDMITKNLYNRIYQHDGGDDFIRKNKKEYAKTLAGEVYILGNTFGGLVGDYDYKVKSDAERIKTQEENYKKLKEKEKNKTINEKEKKSLQRLNEWKEKWEQKQKADLKYLQDNKKLIDEIRPITEKISKIRHSYSNENDSTQIIDKLSSEEYKSRSNITSLLRETFALEEIYRDYKDNNGKVYGGIKYDPKDGANATDLEKLFMSWDSLQSEKGKDFALKNDKNNENIQFTLTIPYDVNYKFQSADGKTLPEEVAKLLPKSYEIEKGQAAYVNEVEKNEKLGFEDVKVADGIWKFKTWDKTKEENVKSDVTFTGTWEFTSTKPLPNPNEAPRLEVADKEIMVGEALDLKTLIIKAIDKEDGDLKDKVQIIDKGGFDNNKVGTYKITYKVTDSKGESVSKQATVKVKEKQKPQAPENKTPKPQVPKPKQEKGVLNEQKTLPKTSSQTPKSNKALATILAVGLITLAGLTRRKRK